VTLPVPATAELRAVDSSHFAVVGELGFDTVRDLLAAGATRFADADARFEVDLSGVSQGDSAGLALLIEWQKLATRTGKTLRFTRVPAQLRALAQISEIEDFLPLSA
jgi:phospholipid transport system transporter-binding protein